MFKKRFQLIAVGLGLALLAVAGLLLVFGRLAAPTGSVARSDLAPPSVAPPESGQAAVTPNDSPTTESPPPKQKQIPAAADIQAADIIATVNDEIITRPAWQQAIRLDVVMSRLAGQPIPSAEETLDRLVNEIIVLAAAPDVQPSTGAEVEARIAALQANWQVNNEAVAAVLVEAGLTRDDMTDRVARLMQVEAALAELSTQETDLNGWLVQARARAEIGLYRALVNNSEANGAGQGGKEAEEQGGRGAGEQQEVNSTPLPPSPLAPQPTLAPPPELSIAPYPENAAPDFTLAQLNGVPLTLSDFRGKPVLLNFWASWCPPCRRELPALQSAYAKYGDNIGFVAVDVKEDPGTAAAFVREMGLTFPVALDLDGQVSDMIYEVRGIPTTIFVDAQGVVVARHVGPLDEAAIDTYLAPLLETAQHQSSPPTNLAPPFTLTAAGGQTISLSDYRDKNNLVLVFYRGQT